MPKEKNAEGILKEIVFLDMGNLCKECGTDSSKYGFVNRVSADGYLEVKASWYGYAIELYICGPCNDIFEGCEASQDWKTYEKEMDEWIKDVDKRFPDAEKFRQLIRDGENERLDAMDMRDLLALTKNYRYVKPD